MLMEEPMASLAINDLAEDAELDVQALKAITGGRPGLGGFAEGLPATQGRLDALQESKLIRGLVTGGLLTPVDGD